MSEGIDIANSPALIAHCVEKMGIDAEVVVELFRAGNVSRENTDILLTKKNIRTRLDRTRPSATVMTIADDYISPFEPRTFTVRELARMQSFDDSLNFGEKDNRRIAKTCRSSSVFTSWKCCTAIISEGDSN